MIRSALGYGGHTTDEFLAYAAQLGCEGVVLHVPDLPHEKGYWEYEDLVRLRERVEGFGVELFSLENTRWDMYEDCMVGGPERDRQLDNYRMTVANIGRAGIGVLGFCWMPNSVWSSSFETEGRGGAKVRSYDHADHEGAGLTHGRVYSAEEMWEHFALFVSSVVPAAEEAGVRLALHPDDPPVTSLGGIARIFSTIDGFKKATEEVCSSPALGLNFCMGTWSEMGRDAALEGLRYFAERDRIVYVHFRDVKGQVPRFEECFIGEGNIDPVEAIRILHSAGFDGFMEEDHVPVMVGDKDMWAARSRAYAAGYIQGVLRAVQGIA